MKKLIFALFCLSFTIPCHARTITVDDDGPADFNNIQAAINDANDYDVVLVADGLYRGEGNRNINAGDSNQTGIVVRSENGPANCIIDGNNARYGFVLDGLAYGYYLPVSSVEGFTITNCTEAINIHQAEPNIKNCVLKGNSSTALACWECSGEITDCVITNNNGNGVDCILGAYPIITNCIITNNKSGIYCDWLTHPTVINCLIAGNKTDLGGGMYCNDGSPTIVNCIISSNKASSDGGGIYVIDGNPKITNSSLTGNEAYGKGGAIYAYGNDCISELINCTVSGNKAGLRGGGIVCDCGADCNIRNCIFKNNAGDYGDDLAYGGTACKHQPHFSVDFSILQSTWAGSGNLVVDPCFAIDGSWVDVNDMNVPVEPNDPNALWLDGDYHLKSSAGRWDPNNQSWAVDEANSPGIDAGDPDSDWTAELWPHGKRTNMGAYGGTSQASMSLSTIGNIANLNNDPYDIVDLNDLAIFVEKWLYEEVLLSEDLDRNGIVNFVDYAVLAKYCLYPPPPAESTIEFEVTMPCGMRLLATEQQADQTRFTVTVEGRYIHFEDTMAANCCPEGGLWLEMTVVDNLITIYEREAGGVCYCICYYPVTATLGPFEPGTYTLEVYEDLGGFIGSTIVEIE